MFSKELFQNICRTKTVCRLIATGLLLALAVLVLTLLPPLLKRCDSVIPVEAELDRYSEYTPFVAGRTYFRGINHDLDINVYEFIIKSEHTSKEEYFKAVDEKVGQYNWVLLSDKGNTRTYRETKPSRLQTAIITVEYRKNSEIYIRSEPCRELE